MVLRQEGRRGPDSVELQVSEAGDHYGIWRRRAVRPPRRLRHALHRGVPGLAVRASTHDAQQDPGPRWDVAVGADGLPLAATNSFRNSGLLQPQGFVLRSRPAQAGILRTAEVLSGEGRREIGNKSFVVGRLSFGNSDQPSCSM